VTSDDPVDSRRPLAPFLSVLLVVFASLLLAPDPRRFLDMAIAVGHWLPWAGLAIAAFGVAMTTNATRRALPFLVLTVTLSAILMGRNLRVDVQDLSNFLATTVLLTGLLLIINYSGRNSSTLRAILTSRWRSPARGAYRDQKLIIFLGHVYLDLTQSCIDQCSASMSASVTAGTVTIYLPAEWRLVLRSSPTAAVIRERGVPRDFASSPAFEITLRGIFALVEFRRL